METDEVRPASSEDVPAFGGIVVLLVVLLPIFEPRSDTLDDAWEILKAPIEALEDPANRLLSGVKANEARAGLSLPDNVLPFRGPITLTDEPLAWVTSRYATMLPGRVYDEYASTGWLVNPQVIRSVEYSFAQSVAEQALKLRTGKEVETFLMASLKQVAPVLVESWS